MRLLVAAFLMMGWCGAMDRTGVRFGASHREPERQRQHQPQMTHRSHYTAFSFQRPRRNSTALATASVENAIVTAQATP